MMLTPNGCSACRESRVSSVGHSPLALNLIRLNFVVRVRRHRPSDDLGNSTAKPPRQTRVVDTRILGGIASATLLHADGMRCQAESNSGHIPRWALAVPQNTLRRSFSRMRSGLGNQKAEKSTRNHEPDQDLECGNGCRGKAIAIGGPEA